MAGSLVHAALGGPDGDTHRGDYLDCGLCRVKLLEAFRAPAEVPEPRITSTPGASFAHLLLPDDPRTVDLSGTVRDRPDPSGVAHITNSRVVPFPHMPGGEWVAECTCGWLHKGMWSPLQGVAWAQSLADKTAEVHRLRPDNDTLWGETP